MIGGVVATVAAPAVMAASAGYGAYRGVRWLRALGWLGTRDVPALRLHTSVQFTIPLAPPPRYPSITLS